MKKHGRCSECGRKECICDNKLHGVSAIAELGNVSRQFFYKQKDGGGATILTAPYSCFDLKIEPDGTIWITVRSAMAGFKNAKAVAQQGIAQRMGDRGADGRFKGKFTDQTGS